MDKADEQPPAKRPRRTDADAAAQQQEEENGDADADTDDADGANDNNDDAMRQQLEGVLGDDDDDFAGSARRQEAEAERRRRLRRQRLDGLKEREEEQQQEAIAKTKVEEQQAASAIATATKQEKDPATETPNGKPAAGGKEDDKGDDDDDDEFDMFSSSLSPVADNNNNKKKQQQSSSTTTGGAATGTAVANGRGQEQEDWDDSEGYYRAMINETITLENVSSSSSGGAAKHPQQHQQQQPSSLSSSSDAAISFRVLGVIGKGVFSTVLKCATTSNASAVAVPPVVAIKCIRHNETMAKAALAEIKFLQKLVACPGIVPLLLPASGAPTTEYRGHVVLVFPYSDYNLRDVLQKFGKGVGLSLQAVRSYSGQLLAAASHLKRHGILHCDIKLDNVLVSADFNTVMLADFGSAIACDSPELQVTPYLVSRFYRAPEIILGLLPTHAVDLWSLAVTVAELYLGSVLFRGKTNNDMLYVMQQHLGPFSNRLVRQHLLACDKFPIPRQFERERNSSTYSFRQETIDPVTGTAVHRLRSLVHTTSATTTDAKDKFPLATPLHHKLLKARSAKDSRTLVMQFSDLLQKCLALDPTRRIDLRDALRHDFFKSTTTKAGSNNTNSKATTGHPEKA